MAHSDFHTPVEPMPQATVTPIGQSSGEPSLSEQLHLYKQLLQEKERQIKQLEQAHAPLVQQINQAESLNKKALAHMDKMAEQMQQVQMQAKRDVQIEMAELEQQLEEANTSKHVMKHHCRDLQERNKELHELLKASNSQVDELQSRLDSQSIDVKNLREEKVKLSMQVIEQSEQLKRCERQLNEALHGYYSGVMNKNKKLSKNLPR
ncbi:hypothetical protein [Pseudoalteromonas ruthenica]|uniref:Uncharacterized protein n=1 Tax=Pseudoalteromonas ruthenica TaxID=151081 RepID=A0A0F4Q6U9_9GAMM|nr:hypothetical protein [Pseudoalteromonas ruthenica]KJY98225.1 hypothetical protein TW76_06895 [Pseudoalteromonas ruthenica]KJZ02292.1 hypothetical protein TW72_01105 [Pseudoalteromonas ruthenica]TMO89710.1 hypothetical protein CWC12_03430 [Pseudoalteromonas ruthenica]TMO92136.1 hypothetical protein CWC13_12775 [Pseudoalteromonas ruthenica]TMP01360.1 hypothetical protein CWC07_03310 [Pseudoalteromonas ruthenica]|tara:strand:+ start:1061 stop:1681 length:621 start_codon:yes stop_codon:yes gene_type:complete